MHQEDSKQQFIASTQIGVPICFMEGQNWCFLHDAAEMNVTL